MRRVFVALIIYWNKYVISKIPSGEFAGRWEFPGGPSNAETTDFQAVRKAIKKKLRVDIFPYLTAKSLLYKSSDETIDLTFIKCSITNKSKRFLSSNVPSEYKWISLPYVAHIDFAPRDKTIAGHLTNGLFETHPPGLEKCAATQTTTQYETANTPNPSSAHRPSDTKHRSPHRRHPH